MATKTSPPTEAQVQAWIEQGVDKLAQTVCSDQKHKHHHRSADCGNWFWFLGFIGAIIYFWQSVDSFGTGVLAILKAFVWPVYLVLHLFRFLTV